jgi:hypothetical protein
MSKNSRARTLGYLSLISSLIPWAATALSFLPKMLTFDPTFGQITLFLGMGTVLSLIAAALGPGRWAFVAQFDLATFFPLVFVLNLREPR